jgi:uncharacterized protein YndB with AHSA1/START domain
MADILHRITAAATPEKIRPLVTTADGFRTWWTDDCEAVPKVGSVSIFRFDGGAVEFHFRMDELSPERAAFTCVAAPKVPPEWVGTRLTFDLAPAKSGGTVVRFGHLGWRSIEGEYPACNTVWGELMHRLKDSAEGRPPGPYFTSGASRSRY